MTEEDEKLLISMAKEVDVVGKKIINLLNKEKSNPMTALCSVISAAANIIDSTPLSKKDKNFMTKFALKQLREMSGYEE